MNVHDLMERDVQALLNKESVPVINILMAGLRSWWEMLSTQVSTVENKMQNAVTFEANPRKTGSLLGGSLQKDLI